MIRAGAESYYLFNAHGDVVQLANTAGGITKTYDYDAFGVERNIDEADANPYRYAGEYFDRESGKIYLRARYYDPVIGRFTQEDPAQAGLNWYTYAGNNPIMFIDPLGLDYIVAWSYGNGEVRDFNGWLLKNGYTNTLLSGTDKWTTEMWSQFDSRSSFARAAQTRVDALIKMGIPENEIHMRRIDSSDDLKSAWVDWAKIKVVEGLDLYSHGYGGGPEVRGGTDASFWDSAAKLNWTSTLRELTINGKKTGYISSPYAAFHGCNTANGDFAQAFANRQGVTTYGSTDYTSFSTKSGSFSGIKDWSTSTPVYLGVYKEIWIFGIRIAKTSRVPMKSFTPQ